MSSSSSLSCLSSSLPLHQLPSSSLHQSSPVVFQTSSSSPLAAIRSSSVCFANALNTLFTMCLHCTRQRTKPFIASSHRHSIYSCSQLAFTLPFTTGLVFIVRVNYPHLRSIDFDLSSRIPYCRDRSLCLHVCILFVVFAHNA